MASIAFSAAAARRYTPPASVERARPSAHRWSEATAEPNSQAKASRPQQNVVREDKSPHTAKPTHTHQHICTHVDNQHGSHWQRRRNDATELAHADMTALPKMDTNCTALSRMPAIIGNTFAASLRTDICPQRKESSSTSHARNPFNLNFFDSAQCLMVRRWRLIG